MRKYDKNTLRSVSTVIIDNWFFFSVYIQRWSRARMQRQPSLPSCQGCPRPGRNRAGLHHPEGHQPHSPDRSQHVSRWDDLTTAMRCSQIYLAKIQQVWFQLEPFLSDELNLTEISVWTQRQWNMCGHRHIILEPELLLIELQCFKSSINTFWGIIFIQFEISAVIRTFLISTYSLFSH